MSRYEAPELRRAKAIRRERLRPLRQFLRESELFPRITLSDYDTEVVRIVPDAGAVLRIDLDDRPLDFDQVLDCLEESIEVRRAWLDDEAARIQAARERLMNGD